MSLLEHSDAVPVEDRGQFQASQDMAPDHVVEAVGSRCGRDVRRITSGEENGTTEHEAMTLPKCKVTAQVTENRSC